jgi:hypothetical protein
VASSAWSFVTARTFGVPREELVAQWESDLRPYYVAKRPIDWRLLRLVVVDVFPHEQEELVVEYDPPGYGPDSDLEPTPPQLSMLISWRSELAGRSHRGRTFWGPSRLSDVLDGQRVTNVEGGTDPLDNFAFTMVENFRSGNLLGRPVHSIISRHLDGEPREPWVFVPVTDYKPDYILRTVRKRNDITPTYS